MEVGNIVKHRNGAYGTVEYSSFGLSIHFWSEEHNALGKTLGASADELKEYWEVIDELPIGYKRYEYGGLIKDKELNLNLAISNLEEAIRSYRSNGGSDTSNIIKSIYSLMEEYKGELQNNRNREGWIESERNR